MKKMEPPKISSLLRDVAGLNIEFAIAGIGGSEEIYKKVLIKAIDRLPSNIEAMDNFLKEKNGLSDFAIKVHGVKGSLLQVGCLDLASCAENLEKAAKEANRQYCDINYGSFKENLLKFYEQVNNILRSAEDKDETLKKQPGNIYDYIDALTRVKEAAAEYDTALAAKNLAPLLKLNFGGDIDNLLKKAADELGAYHPRKALICVAGILDKCQPPR